MCFDSDEEAGVADSAPADSLDLADSQATLTLGDVAETQGEVEFGPVADVLPGMCVVPTADGPVETQHPEPEPVGEHIFAVGERGVCHPVVVCHERPLLVVTWFETGARMCMF